MSFTILSALLALIIFFIMFVALLYRWKGLKVAVIVTGITTAVLAGVLLLAIGVIVSSMPN